MQRIVLGIGVFVVLAALTGAGGGMWLIRQVNSIERAEVAVDGVAKGDPANYLIVGSDSRSGANADYGEDDSGRRSDSMMVLRLDPKAETAKLLSLPRDLIVDIPGHGRDRMNASFNEAAGGSPDLLKQTISENFDIEINHYVEVDFNGFKQMVDAVGGIPMQVSSAVKDEHSGLIVDSLGCVNLDGEMALAYMRSRHLQYFDGEEWSEEDPYADLDRIQRQQQFVRVALSKILADINSNPLKVTEYVGIASGNVIIDEATDPLSLAKQFKDFSLDRLETLHLPVDDNPNGDGATVVLRESEAETVLNPFRGLDSAEVSPGVISVDVLNGTGTEQQAANVAGALGVVGFKIGERADYDPQPVERTTVYHAPGEEFVGLRLARHITAGNVAGDVDLQVRDDLSSGHAVVVTGLNFTNVHREATPLEQMPTALPGAEAPSESDEAPASPPTTAPSTTTTTHNPYILGDTCS